MTVTAQTNANRIAIYGLILTGIGIGIALWKDNKATIEKTNEKLDKILIIGQSLNDHIATDGVRQGDLTQRISSIEAYFIQADEPLPNHGNNKSRQLFFEPR
jgi:hypothetical protein